MMMVLLSIIIILSLNIYCTQSKPYPYCFAIHNKSNNNNNNNKSNNNQIISQPPPSNNQNGNNFNKNTPKGINNPNYWPKRYPAKELCSKCGLCDTSFIQYVNTSCAFLNEGMKRIDRLEERVHGRRRKNMSDDNNNNNNHDDDDEVRFGVLHQPIVLAKGMSLSKEYMEENLRPFSSSSSSSPPPIPQWTGVVTNIALSMLENNLVDAVVCIASATTNDNKSESSSSSFNPSFAEPLPIIARTTDDILKGCGVKPSLAPSLNILDEIQNDKSIRKLLFCGVGCSVQAFRSIEHLLDLDEVYVLGTNCADNSPTAMASNRFMEKAMSIENIGNVLGYEFMQDYNVHVKMKPNVIDDHDHQSIVYYKKKPYFCLPREVATDAIAKSCLACFDYTNALADVVVGYMGSPPLDQNGSMDTSFQTLTCRNEKGKRMIENAVQMKRIRIDEENYAKSKSSRGLISFETLALFTTKEDIIVQQLVKERNRLGSAEGELSTTMPLFLGQTLATVLNLVGPKGLEFAKYSIDYHILRNYLYVLKEWGIARVEKSLPEYAKDIVKQYSSSKDFQALKSAILFNNNKEVK